jgi:hypothetical protein
MTKLPEWLEREAEEYAVKNEQATLNIERLKVSFKAGALAVLDRLDQVYNTESDFSTEFDNGMQFMRDGVLK